jgi:hypothetical protein
MKVVILVPRRDDDGPRDALWDWCRAWWEREQSHMPIFEGYHTEGLFNRSAAVNRAARLAGDWDVAVIIDADVVCDPNRVKEAVELAHTSGSMVLPHNERLDLSEQASRLYRSGQVPDLTEHRARRRFVRRRYAEDNGHPSVSSVVVVPRSLWNEVGGFDETFRGWGYEDTAFAAAAETFGGIIRMPGEVVQRYRAAIGDKSAIRALQAEGLPAPLASSGIPRILHRTVPATTDPTVEAYWAAFEGLHPDWTMMTHRDPLDPSEWPLTSSHWGDAANGAQLADMIRLEALLRWGGVYVDSDVEPLRSLEPLLPLQAFAAWEDARCVPNAVMGAVPGHPAVRACLDEMLSRIPGPTWEAGPGVLTEILPGRTDVLLLPPGAFFPYHYREKERAGEDFRTTQPWAFVVHHWAGSWLKSA